MLHTRAKLIKPRLMRRRSTSKTSRLSTKRPKKRSSNSSMITEMRLRLLMRKTDPYQPTWKNAYHHSQAISKRRKQKSKNSLRSGRGSRPISRNWFRKLSSSSKMIPAPLVRNRSQRRRKGPISWTAKAEQKNLVLPYQLLMLLWRDDKRLY